MSYDAKKAAYQEVTILGRPALFAECRIDNSTVPKGLYRYELRHGDENWGDPVSLSRNIIVNYYGAVLTREPFQLPIEGWIPLEDDSLSFQDGGCRTLAEFQRKYPVSKKDVIDFFVANDDSLHDFYFSHSEAQDKATGCVGHLRGDFGSGKQFFTTWWPHQGDQLNTPAFKADIDRAVNWLREQPDSPLHDFDTMKRFCGRFERSCAIKGAMLPSYAFMAKTKQYVYIVIRTVYTVKRYRVKGKLNTARKKKITGFYALYLRYLYLLRGGRRKKLPPKMPFSVKREVIHLERYEQQFKYLLSSGITTEVELERRIRVLEWDIRLLKEQRKPLYRERRNAKDEETQARYSVEIEQQTAALRENAGSCACAAEYNRTFRGYPSNAGRRRLNGRRI